MNNTSDSNSSQSANANPSDGAANPQASSQSGRRALFESLRSAATEGAQRAKAAADSAIPRIKTAACCATYWLGYGASFASVFSYTVVKELAPEALKTGCLKGAQAGRKAAEDLSTELKEPSAARNASPPPDPSLSVPATLPGTA